MALSAKLKPEEIGALLLVSVTPSDRALAGWSMYGDEDELHMKTFIDEGGTYLIGMLHAYAINSPGPDRDRRR